LRRYKGGLKDKQIENKKSEKKGRGRMAQSYTGSPPLVKIGVFIFVKGFFQIYDQGQ
jgi:hypothetical protein